jgi:hypothetical protein
LKNANLPAGYKATIEIEKIEDYCLNKNHPVGKHKAKVFHSVLGINAHDSVWLMKQILEKLPESAAQKRYDDEFGIRYQMDIMIEKGNKKALVSTIWLYSIEDRSLRLITFYVKK